MLESVEATHSSHSFNNRVASLLGMTHPPRRMDSQAKYCSLARGDGGLYLRMPVSAGYQEKIWVRLLNLLLLLSAWTATSCQDHAAGNILVHESGGLVTDSRGAPLNFARGRTLGENLGIVAAGKAVHSKVLAAIQQLRLEEEVDKDKGEVSAWTSLGTHRGF
jgi:3'(2'), 5'-bisphosphate nucleotidase